MNSILHLSDLHISNGDTWTNLAMVKNAVAEIQPKPSLIVVSGDFTDHPANGAVGSLARWGRKLLRRPAVQLLPQIKAELEKLRLSCGPDCPLVVVPGNHDCREFGLAAWKTSSDAFTTVYPDWKTSVTLRMGDRRVVVFTIDSNTNDARVNAARGRVGSAELLRFRTEYDRLKQAHPAEFQAALKIVVLHHHPLPIADSEDAGYFGTDGFLGLDDAGIFLREMAARHIDVVLHGHKHQAFNTRVEISLPSLRRGLAVIAAGSATKAGPFERSFNVIYVNRRSISGEVRALRKGTLFWATETFPIVSYERHLARAFEDFRSAPEVSCCSDQLHVVYSIKETGDCHVSSRFRALTPSGNRPANGAAGACEIEVNRNCPHGTFSRHEWKMWRPHPSTVRFVPASVVSPGKLIGTVGFHPPLQPGGPPANVEQSYSLYNAFASNQEQRGRIDADAKTERVTVAIARPVGELIVTIHFSDTNFPTDIRAFVKDESKQVDAEETERSQRHLQLCPPNRTVTLVMSKPLRGCAYVVEWDLPPGPTHRYRGVDRGRCEEIRKKLLELKGPAPGNVLAGVFADECARMAEEYRTPIDQMELGLMVYDPAIKRLRFVAGKLHPASWDYHLYDGQGIAGRAHKLDLALVWAAGHDPDSDFVALPPVGRTTPKIIVCVPIRYPISTPVGVGETIAVLTMSTDYGASEMLRLVEDDSRGILVSLEAQLLFGKQLLPKLGFANWV